MSLKNKIRLIVVLILIYSMISGLLLIYTTVNLYCLLFLIQNISIPFIATRFLIDDLQKRFSSSSGAIGALIGLVVSIIPTAIMVIIPIVLIYLNGTERATQYNKFVFATMLASGIGIWFVLIILSTLVGLISSIRFQRRKLTQ